MRFSRDLSLLCLQFKDGVLVIRHGNEAYVPSGDVKVEMVGQGEEEDDDDEFDWVYGVIIGVGVAFILLLVILLTVVSALSIMSVHLTLLSS